MKKTFSTQGFRRPNALRAALAACAFAALVPASRADDAGALSLAQVLDAVLARYPTIDSAQAAIDSAHGRTMQSGADRLPQVTANGEYVHMTLRPYVQFGPVAFNETIHDSYNANVTVRQLLTDFGRTDALVDLARTGEISARDALEQTRSQLGYEAIQDYYGVLLLRQSVSVADEEVRALDEALRVAKQKFANGSATKFDVLTTQVRLANAENRRTDTVSSLRKQEAALGALLGLAPESPLVLAGDFAASAPSAPDLSSAIAEGLRNRPEVKLAQDASRSAQLRFDAADRSDRPTISAQASGGVEDQQLPYLYDNRGYADAGVNVTVPLFTGHRTAGQRVEARADLRQADARVHELTLTVSVDVQAALSDLQAASSRLASADTLVAQAQEALALAQSRYSNGVITNFELLDAQSSARSSELARLQARYDCVLAAQALARAEGRPPSP